jgi:integrase
VSIRKRTWTASGETKTAWVVDYVDQNGKRRLKTFELKKAAEAWGVTARHEVAQRTHAPDSRATIDEVFDKWIDHCTARGLERSTIEQRKRHLKLHVGPFIGRMKLADLSTPGVNLFMDRLREAGRSVAMRRKVLTSLSSALKYAKRQGLVAQNVVLDVEVESNKRGKARVAIPTKAELKLLIDRAPERWRAFFITAVFTGMRASELRGLRWRDVGADTIHVTQRADTWGVMGPPKSAAGTRDIPLTPMVINALRKRGQPDDLVFTNNRGGIIVYTNFHRCVWTPLLRACGLNYQFHSLRHAAASLFIELGWQPKRIQAVMGHSSITMTYDTYGHLFPQGDVSEDMRRLEAAVLVAA